MDIEILNEAKLRAWCARIKMEPGAVDELAAVSGQVQADPDLLERFTAFHEQTAVRGEWHTTWDALPQDPAVAEKLGRRSNLFYLLAYLAAMPYTAREYERLGIGMEIFDATLWDITRYTNEPSELKGYWTFDNFAWVWRHLTCRLFRLGRLQYMLTPYHGHATAFKNKTSGEVLLLCGDGLPMRADGSELGAGIRKIASEELAYSPDEAPAFTTAFEETPEGWRGNPSTPYGYALNETLFLPRSEWEVILTPGDTVMDLHIPIGKDLTTEDIRASMAQAREFFTARWAAYWPEPPIRAAFCHTWFFTPQLQQLLPPTSSIVKFQREFYLYPNAGGPGFLWSFVFGDKYPNPAAAPRDTSLRRAVLDWLAEGKLLYDLPGVMFHPAEEWGTQPYMGKYDSRQ